MREKEKERMNERKKGKIYLIKSSLKVYSLSVLLYHVSILVSTYPFHPMPPRALAACFLIMDLGPK